MTATEGTVFLMLIINHSETLKSKETMHLQLIEVVTREFSKMDSYKINIEKSICFRHVSNKINRYIFLCGSLGMCWKRIFCYNLYAFITIASQPQEHLAMNLSSNFLA